MTTLFSGYLWSISRKRLMNNSELPQTVGLSFRAGCPCHQQDEARSRLSGHRIYPLYVAVPNISGNVSPDESFCQGFPYIPA